MSLLNIQKTKYYDLELIILFFVRLFAFIIRGTKVSRGFANPRNRCWNERRRRYFKAFYEQLKIYGTYLVKSNIILFTAANLDIQSQFLMIIFRKQIRKNSTTTCQPLVEYLSVKTKEKKARKRERGRGDSNFTRGSSSIKLFLFRGGREEEHFFLVSFFVCHWLWISAVTNFYWVSRAVC